MKTIILMTFLFFTGIIMSQNLTDVDQRLVDNHGDNIYRIYEKQFAYYQFLVWELDNGYEIVDKNTVQEENILTISNIKSTEGVLFHPSELLSNPKTFNFIKYNFVRQKNVKVYYDLGNDKVMVFSSLSGVWDEFRNRNNNN